MRIGVNKWVIVFLGLVYFFSTPGVSQNLTLIESYRSGLQSATPEKQFELLNAIGFEYRYSIPDSTIYYCSRAFELGKKIKIGKELSRPLSFIGLAKANQGDYKAALDYQSQALEVARLQSDTLQMAHGYNNIGRVFFDQGDLVRAYSNFMLSKELFEDIHDKSGLAYVHRSLAGLFKSKKDFRQALENSEEALKLRKELGDPRAITSAYMELGLVYEEMDTTPLALRQFHLADSIATMVNDEITKAELKVGMAEILFLENKNAKEAESMAKEVLNVVTENTNQKIFLRARLLLAKSLVESKKNAEVLPILDQIYSVSDKTGNLSFQRDAAQLLSTVYGRQGNSARSREYNDIYQILDEKVLNADLNREIERLQFQLQIEKTEKENVSLKAKQIEDESLIARQRSQNIMLIVIALVVAFIAAYAWRESQKRKSINRRLEEQSEEIAKQNESLYQHNRELDELNHEKDTIMNIVAHDLKAPINRISGLVGFLEMEGNLNENQQNYVRLVKNSTRSGLDLIKDLLDVHSLEENHEKINTVPFPFHSFFREKVEAFKTIGEPKRIKVVGNNYVTGKINSEPGYIGRIMDNLISNAIKFSPSDTTVEVNTDWKNGFLNISVRDAGPGFTDEDRPLMFQKFKKLTARPTGGESSNGLGLAIVKTLVDRLRGSIELHSAPGKGSQFLVSIPAGIVQETKTEKIAVKD
jgi:signal transduction histidine kinase